MKKRKKENGLRNKRYVRIFVSLCIILFMTISLVPNKLLFAQGDMETKTEETTEQEVISEESKEPVTRETMDFGQKNDILTWQLEALRIETKQDTTKNVKPNNATIDISQMPRDEVKNLQMLFTFSVPLLNKDTYILKGDSVTIALPQDIVLPNGQNNLPVYTYEKSQYDEQGFLPAEHQEQIAEGSVDEQNILHISFLENITEQEKQEIFAVLPIEMEMPQEQTNISVSSQEPGQSVQLLFPSAKSLEKQQETDHAKENDITEQEQTQKEADVSKVDPLDSVKENKNTEAKKTDEVILESNDIRESSRNAEDVTSHSFTRMTRQITTKLQQLFSDTPYRYIISEGLPEGFETVKINIQNKTGGYTNADSDPTVGFTFDISLDDDYLFTQLERVLNTMPNAPVFAGDAEAYDKEILAFLKQPDVEASLAKLEYTFDLGENFKNAKVDSKKLTDQSGDIGSYWIEDGMVHVVFTNEMYYYSNVSISCNFDVHLDDDANLSDTPQDLEFDHGQLILKQIGSIDGSGEQENKVKYTVDKDAPLKVNSPEIPYTITVKAMDAKDSLKDKWFVDTIPEGLKVKKLSKVVDGKETEIKNVQVSQDGLLYYQIMEDKQEITFHLVLEANDSTYQNLITAGSMDVPFVNKAFLKDETKADNLAESSEVSTQMKVIFLKKEGKQQDLEGTKFNWTIQANTKLPYFKKGYLVDTFSYSDHMLAQNTSLNITFQGKTTSYHVADLNVRESNKPYESLTMEDIKSIGGDRDTQEPFYYIYDTNNKSEYQGEEQQKQCVLLIPFDQLHGTTESETVKIQYITELNQHGLSIDDYLNRYSSISKQIGNKVNLLWENETGKGPNPAAWTESVNFSKDVDTNVDIMNKKGTYYDPATQMAYWDLEINRMGANIQPASGKDEVEVTDIFDKGAYDTSTFKVSYTEYKRNGATSSTEEIKNVTIQDGEAGKKVLTLTMPALDTNTYRIYHIQAKLTDPQALSQQSDTISISNSAKINASVNGEPKETTTTANMKIKNTLIIKEASKSYDYKNHLFTWKVIVNPNRLNIKDAEVKDILALHTSFQKILSAVDQDGNVVTDKIGTSSNTTEEIEGVTYPVTTFTLKDIAKKSYTIEYTTKLEDTNLLTSLEDATTFNNKVVLSGTIVENTGTSQEITDAFATANIPVKNNQMEKGGVYDAEDGSILWTVYVNKDQANMKNLTFVENLREQLQADEPSIQSLDQNSLQIFQVAMKEDGTVDTSTQTEVTETMKPNVTINGYDGFTWKFTSEDKNTYKLTFKTYLNEHATGATIANEVYLKDNTDKDVENSNSSDGGYDGGYNFDDNAQKNPRPKLAICKISSNSVDENQENKKHTLDNAKFKITAYPVTKGLDDYTPWTLESPIATYDKISISNQGMAYFLNVMNKDNMIYKLTEEEAPAGYNKQTDPIFFRFVSQEAADKEEVYLVIENETVYSIKPIKYGANIPIENIIIKDEPADNASYSFTKYIPETVKDGKIDIYKPASKGITFYLHAIDDLEGKVQDRFVTTDQDGKITLKKLDPGKYTLTEVASDTDLDVGGSFTLTVGLDKTGKYTFALAGAGNHGLSIKEDGNLYNDYVKGRFSFKKYANYKQGTGDQIVNGNKEPIEGVTFKLAANSTDTNKPNAGYEKTVTSLSDGSVTFDNLPVGSYTLIEEKKQGYQENTNSYTVNITETEGDVLATGTSNATVYKGKKAKVEITPELTDDIITNTPETGTIQLKKVINSTTSGITTNLDGKPLPGIEFGLYRKIGNDVAKEPLKKSTSSTSDPSGIVTFKDVEYGDYVCREITDHPYFKKLNKDVSISRTDMTFNENQSFTYEEEIANELYTKTLKLHKQDQDGNALQGIGFTLYRRSSHRMTTESNLSDINTENSTTSYYPYLGKTSTSDNNGNFVLENLIVGDYLLVEDLNTQDLQEGHNKVALQIQITKTSVVVQYQDNFEKELLDASHYVLANDEITETKGWHKLTLSDDYYTLVNQRKFAYVQVNKQSGEYKDSEFQKTKYSTPLVGCVFQINKISEDDKEQPYIRLTTNQEGMFDITDDGKLIGKDEKGNDVQKHLYYGRYTIQEITGMEGYQTMGTKTSFSIDDEDTTASHGGTVWMSNENAKEGYSIIGENSDRKAFINPFVRSAVTLQKKGLEDVNLKDAVFAIYQENTLAAYLKYDGSAYTLTDTYGENTIKTEEGKIPYLYENKLLPGEYRGEEIVIPKGYRKASFQINIAQGGAVTFTAGTGCKIENNNTLYELPIAFNIEKVDDKGKTLNGAEFRLEGTFADGTSSKTLTEANKAQLLTNSQYTLIETKAPKGYRCAEKTPTLQFNEVGEVTIINGEGILELVNGSLQFKDEPLQIQLVKKEKGQEDTVLAGAHFTVRGTFTDDSKTEITDLVSDAKGFVNLYSDTWNLIATNTYELIETQAPEGYALPSNHHTFTIDAYGNVDNTHSNQIVVEDTPIHIEVEKIDATDKQGIDASFILTDKTANTTKTIQTKDGKAVLEKLIQGHTYNINETATTSGYILPDEKEIMASFTVQNDGSFEMTKGSRQGQTIMIENERKTGSVELTKTDAVSQEALDGAIFTLYKKGQNLGAFATGKNYTKDNQGKYIATQGDNGRLRISDLTWGDYRLVESKAADGYQLENKEASFTIGKHGTEMLLEVKGLTITNLRSKVSFHKAASYVEHCSDATLGSGALPADATKALAGAEFHAYDEDGNVFATSISDASGNVSFAKMLADHTYTIKETKAPEGFIKQTHTYQVHIQTNGQSDDIIDMTTHQPVTDIVNQVQRTDMVLNKVSEHDEKKILPNAVYGLYRMTSHKDEHPQLIATEKTDASGVLRFQGVLLHQTYLIKELQAPEGSHVSKHSIMLEYVMKNDEIAMKLLDDGNGTVDFDKEDGLVWHEPDVVVRLHKTDTNGSALADASLAIVDDKNTIVDSWKSDGKPHTIINQLVAGKTYQLQEMKAPKGYYVKEPVTFTVEEKVLAPGEQYIQEVTMENELTSITVEKRDKKNHEFLTDAVFTIYDAKSMKPAEDYQGQTLAWTSKGRDTLTGVESGQYILREMTAPKHYQIAKDIPFTLQEDGTLQVNGKTVEKLIVLDEAETQTVNTSKAETKPKEKKPKNETMNIETGDTTQKYFYIGVCLLAILGIGVFLGKRKK